MKRQSKKRPITRELLPPWTSIQLNQVLASDFMRNTLYGGRPFRTLNVIDEGNQEALQIKCGTSIPSARLVRAWTLDLGLWCAWDESNGQWPWNDVGAFTEWAKEKRIALMFIQTGEPNQNAFVERFDRSFRDEVSMRIYSTQLQRFKRPLRLGWWITTTSDPITLWVIKLQWSSCRWHLKYRNL